MDEPGHSDDLPVPSFSVARQRDNRDHHFDNLVINSNEEMGTIEFGTPTVDSYVEVTTNFE